MSPNVAVFGITTCIKQPPSRNRFKQCALWLQSVSQEFPGEGLAKATRQFPTRIRPCINGADFRQLVGELMPLSARAALSLATIPANCHRAWRRIGKLGFEERAFQF
jgi:hypothetical protein